MKWKFLFFYLIFAYNVNAQTKYDTIIIMDYFERNYFDINAGNGEDALQIIIGNDTFKLKAEWKKHRLKFKNKVKVYRKNNKYLDKRFPQIAIYSAGIDFEGLRIIKPIDSSLILNISSIKTKAINSNNSNSFDTSINFQNIRENFCMYWNVFNVSSGRYQSFLNPNFVYGIHNNGLPTISEIRALKKPKQVKKALNSIDNVIKYEINLITGIITDYSKTKKQ